MTLVIGEPAPRALVFDCFSGIAGDMTLAALLDAGADIDVVRNGLAKLGLPSFKLDTVWVTRGGIKARYLKLKISEERTYQPDEMRDMVRKAGLPERVTERAIAAIDALALGEADAHETDTPHLHEAGGVDAMIDIVGAMLALEDLGVAAAWCPVVTVGAGAITKAAHGPLPASPGPAAANILRRAGFAQRFVQSGHELVTPTGAAILAAVAKPGPAVLRPEAQGAGAGSFDPPERPNALRVFIGLREDVYEPVRDTPSLPGVSVREVVLLEANIDDMEAELLAHARDRLLEAGAFDAWLEPIGMKKGRSATKLCALVPPEEEARFAGIFLSETTTLGVRTHPYRRYEARRSTETVITSMGPVRVKVREWQGKRRVTPEYDEVRRLAIAHNVPAIEVQRRLEAELTGK